MSVFGQNFGSFDSSPAIVFGASGCSSTRWTSDSLVHLRDVPKCNFSRLQVSCQLVPGPGSHLQVGVLVGNQSHSLEGVYSYYSGAFPMRAGDHDLWQLRTSKRRRTLKA